MYLRQAMGPFAQGPVALIARHRDECVFSADAMGLRPLWQLETDQDFIFSSEPGVVSVDEMVSEPKPMAPGEKFMVMIDRERQALDAPPARRDAARGPQALAARGPARSRSPATIARSQTGGPLEGPEIPGYTDAGPEEPVKVEDRVLAGFGWQRDDVKLVQQMADNGAEPIGSLGYDGPLAALSPERQNLADYFKETVAVVTNPAIDREREIEHFSTRAVFGRRPPLGDPVCRHPDHRDRLPRDPRRDTTTWRRSRTPPTGGSPASREPTSSRTSGRRSATAPRRSTSRCSSRRRRRGRSSAFARRRSRPSARAPS